MGQRIIETAFKTNDIKVVGAIDQSGVPEEGEDIGEVIGLGNLGVELLGSDKTEELLERVDSDVLVDFTVAEAAVEHIEAAARAGVSVVVGTTGFSESQLSEIENIISDYNIPAVISSNMSVGVNVFFRLVEEAASKLDEYDMELVEAHHNQKVDAPSGTALTAAKLAADAADMDFEEAAEYGRDKGQIGERGKEEIGIHSIRAGDISGDHKFILAGPNERLELVHRAQNRQVFVDGTMRAIRYITAEGRSGKIVDMMEILFCGGESE